MGEFQSIRPCSHLIEIRQGRMIIRPCKKIWYQRYGNAVEPGQADAQADRHSRQNSVRQHITNFKKAYSRPLAKVGIFPLILLDKN